MGYTVISDGKRACIACGAIKPVEEFYAYPYKTKQGNRSKRYDSRCKFCARARRKAHYDANAVRSQEVARKYKRNNREAVNRSVRAYREANREFVLASRRASQAKRKATEGEAGGAEYLRVLEEARFGDRYLDAYSGELIDAPTVDHIEALSAGGAHDYWNMCVTSHANNSEKNARSLLIWLLLR